MLGGEARHNNNKMREGENTEAQRNIHFAFNKDALYFCTVRCEAAAPWAMAFWQHLVAVGMKTAISGAAN